MKNKRNKNNQTKIPTHQKTPNKPKHHQTKQNLKNQNIERKIKGKLKGKKSKWTCFQKSSFGCSFPITCHASTTPGTKTLHKDRQRTQLYITLLYNWLFAEEQITGDACGVTFSDCFGIHTYLHIPGFKSYDLAGLRWRKASSVYSFEWDTLHINR